MTSWPQTRHSLLARLADPADESAWQEVQHLYQPAIYRYARNRGLQEADAFDVVQEVMLALHRAIGAWQPSQRAGSFRAWLAETARRLTLQVVRHGRRAGQGAGGTSIRAALESLAMPSASAREEAEERQRWEFFCAAAQVETQVQQSTWRAFWLTTIEGRAPEEVAAELGLTVGNVYSAKCRVLARIRCCVQQMSEVNDEHM